MRITIIALGSRGDVLPYTTLGGALRQAGHQVRMATFENFRRVVAAQGLEFHPIRGDAQAILGSSTGVDMAGVGPNVLRTAIAILRLFGPATRDYAADLSELSRLKTDAIINQLPGGLFGYDLAEKLGVPHLLASVIPLARTQECPMLAFSNLFSRLPGYNALTYRIAEQIVWQAFRPTVNRWRVEVLGLPKSPFGGYFNLMEKAKTTILNGFSRHVVPKPKDWGEHIHITGYWFPAEPEWQPTNELVHFIEAGKSPVYISFGSMPVGKHPEEARSILEGIIASGQRVVLGRGWGDLGISALPDQIFPIDYAPYGWLFSRMAAVVHHGGSGTTAFGLRAGVPGLVVPFLFDQFYWGRRLAELGVSPEPLPFKLLTADKLAQGIQRLVTDDDMCQRAAALGEKIRAENGLQRAVEIFEKVTRGTV